MMHMQCSVKIKRLIKYGCGKIMGADADKIEQTISKAEIISFDIFDTLVKRNVILPECVHDIVRESFMHQTGIDIPKYPELRLNAEKEARKYSKKEEIFLEDIFDFLYGISDNDKKKLQEIEEETELAVCCPDLRMKKIYEKALMDGKRIIITSDMYLEEKAIKKILNKCGYEHYEKLYLSSAYGLCKSTGSIYEVIKKDYSNFKGKILHIGDNVKSDYVFPKMKRIEAILIDGHKNSL